MKPGVWLIAAGAGLAIAAYLGRNQLGSIVISNSDAMNHPNVKALGDTIARFESGGDYTTLYHTPHHDPLYDPSNPLNFSGFSTHPNIRIPFTDPRNGKPNYSTAAGKYQITHPTFMLLSKLPSAPKDFGPDAQEWFFVALLKINGALAPIMAGDFKTAMKLASKTWASLPYTDSKQVHVSLASAQSVYQQAGGQIA